MRKNTFLIDPTKTCLHLIKSFLFFNSPLSKSRDRIINLNLTDSWQSRYFLDTFSLSSLVKLFSFSLVVLAVSYFPWSKKLTTVKLREQQKLFVSLSSSWKLCHMKAFVFVTIWFWIKAVFIELADHHWLPYSIFALTLINSATNFQTQWDSLLSPNVSAAAIFNSLIVNCLNKEMFLYARQTLIHATLCDFIESFDNVDTFTIWWA